MSSATTPRPVTPYRPPAAWRQITWRMGLVLAAAAFVVGYPIYIFLDQAITHGIHHRGDLLDVDLKAMSSFDMDQVHGVTSDIPRPYRELDGKRVLLAGEIWAPDSAANQLDHFQLCYSISRCCFMGPPLVQHFVGATVSGGRTINYAPGIVNVIGTLHVGVQRGDNGQVASVYRIDVDRVDP
jgi:hypothetical protein